MTGKRWEWSPEAVERSQAEARRRRERKATSERYPRWTAGQVEGVTKRLLRLGVDEDRIVCFLDYLHALDQRRGGGPGELSRAVRRSKVDDEALLAAVDRAWAVRPATFVSAGLPTLGKGGK